MCKMESVTGWAVRLFRKQAVRPVRRVVGSRAAVVVAAAVFAVSCAPEAVVDVEDAAEPGTDALPLPGEDAVWQCGTVKQHVFAVIEALASAEQAALEQAVQAVAVLGSGPEDNDSDDSELGAAVEAARAGFSASDQRALNEACELYGRHETALRLWESGRNVEACAVWEPAKRDADRALIWLDALHPIASNFWVGATGAVSEGAGVCMAEQNAEGEP